MGQVSREMNQNPPSGGLRYNLGDYIRQQGLCKIGMSHFMNMEKYKIMIVIQEQVQLASRTKPKEHNISQLRLFLTKSHVIQLC